MKTLITLLGVVAGGFVVMRLRHSKENTLSGRAAMLGGDVTALSQIALKTVKDRMAAAYENLRDSKTYLNAWKELPSLTIRLK